MSKKINAVDDTDRANAVSDVDNEKIINNNNVKKKDDKLEDFDIVRTIGMFLFIYNYSLVLSRRWTPDIF